MCSLGSVCRALFAVAEKLDVLCVLDGRGNAASQECNALRVNRWRRRHSTHLSTAHHMLLSTQHLLNGSEAVLGISDRADESSQGKERHQHAACHQRLDLRTITSMSANNQPQTEAVRETVGASGTRFAQERRGRGFRRGRHLVGAGGDLDDGLREERLLAVHVLLDHAVHPHA